MSIIKSIITRRNFVILFLGGIVMAMFWKFRRIIGIFLAKFDQPAMVNTLPAAYISDIYVAKNGTPQENVARVLEMMGGIERFIGKKDIVILKLNTQWWNQGRTNLAAMKGFIDQVLQIPNFKGEIIIAENNHFMDDTLDEPDNVRGWVHFSDINGEIDGVNHNVNTLLNLYLKKGINNVTKYHWRDGRFKREWFGNGQDGGIVQSPAEGDGYVWSDIEYHFIGLWGLKSWKVKMSYPIFTSQYSGITIDFKNGSFLRDGTGGGNYLKDRPVKFINFAVLNDHGYDTGITSAVKNYMGITDLSCGYWGFKPEGYANVHYCGEGFYPFAKAGVLGHFMKTIRKADLNIVTAEWVGWGHRTDINRAERLRTIVASTDPIALDYYSAKHLFYPLSKKREFHDPDYQHSSIRKFLNLALTALGEGTINENNMRIHQSDFNISVKA